jgi:hypothetical protein
MLPGCTGAVERVSRVEPEAVCVGTVEACEAPAASWMPLAKPAELDALLDSPEGLSCPVAVVRHRLAQECALLVLGSADRHRVRPTDPEGPAACELAKILVPLERGAFDEELTAAEMDFDRKSRDPAVGIDHEAINAIGNRVRQRARRGDA